MGAFWFWFILGYATPKGGSDTLVVGHVTQPCHMKTRVGSVCLNHRRDVMVLTSNSQQVTLFSKYCTTTNRIKRSHILQIQVMRIKPRKE